MTWGGIAFIPGPAMADSPPPADVAEEVIVVTAQRRPEPPEKVPISLTALSGAELERLQATDMAGLGKVVPSLVMTRTGAFTQPYLRGIGKRSTLGVENGVATYLDGIYLASSISALLDLRGVARVEVLNGPQGTLFGRNTTGGVIQIVTKDPMPGRSASVALHGGSYDLMRADLFLTGGSDRLAGNLALSLSSNGGYGTNLFTGKKDQGEVDRSLVARSKWVWRPSNSFKLTLAGDYQHIDQDFSQRPLRGYPAIGEPRVDGFRDGDQDASNQFNFKYGGLSLIIDADIGSLTFKSLTGARRMDARYGTDLDQGPAPILFGAARARQGQFSQEIQIQSAPSAPVRWIAGLNYLAIAERYDPTVFGFGGEYSQRLGGVVFQALSDIGKVSAYAAYGQATWRIDNKTRLTGGLRYTIERRSVRASGERLFDNPPFVRPIPGLPLSTEPPLRRDKRFGELTWRASLDRDLSNRLIGYVSASRGFQSGGWNLQTPQSPAFAPEVLRAYEAGLKYAARPAGITADVSAFIYDYSDLQVSAFTPSGSVTTNATSAKIQGLDLQVGLRPDGRTDVTLGAQLLKARYGRFTNATCTNYDPDAEVRFLPVACDVTGNAMPFAPELKFNFAANHVVSLGKNGTLLVSGNVAYNHGYFSEPDNVIHQDAFATIDASAEWRAPRSGVSVRLWALNLSNAQYSDSLVTFPTAGVLQRPAAPRRFGVSIGYDF